MSFLNSFLGEDWNNYRRSWVHHTGMQLATLTVLAATYTVVVFGFALSVNLKNILAAWGDGVQLTAYLKDEMNEGDVTALKEQIMALDGVGDVSFVPREAATENFKSQMASYAPDLLSDADFANPFPSSFRIRLKGGVSNAEEVGRLEKMAGVLQHLSGVEDVSYGQSWIHNYSSFCSTLYASSGVLSLILLAGSLLVIGNSIRAAISARRDEIEILELVGATAQMIRRPFVTEGLLTGGLAAALALLINFALVMWQKSVMSGSLVLSRLAPMLSYLGVGWILGVLAFGALLGGFGAWVDDSSNQRRMVGGARFGTLMAPLVSRKTFVVFLFGLTVASSARAWSEGEAAAEDLPSASEDATAVNEDRAVTKEQLDLAQKLQETKQGLVVAEEKKRKILGSIYSINKRMKRISSDKGQLTNQLFQVQDNVKSIAKVIASLEVQIERQRGELKKRLRALYKLSGQGYIGVLFSQSTTTDLDETLRFLKIITDADYHLIKSYQENLASYKAQKLKLHGQIEKLVAIEKNIKKQEGLLADEHKAKSKIVSALDREQIENMNRIKTLRTKSHGLNSDTQGGVNLADLFKPSIFEQKGQLAAPVLGTVVQDFGLVTDEKYKTRLSHKGWLFSSSHAAAVGSIFDGTVVFVGWIEGYGQTVIVDHGDHYYSVYGHITRAKVKTGDTLKKGQVFAESGPTPRTATRPAQNNAGPQSNEGLYFEIRHFSEPENPASWLSKQQYRQASNDDWLTN